MASEQSYLRPMLGLGITQVSRAAFDESGAGGANLQVRKERDTFVSLHPAVEFGAERNLVDGELLRHYLRVGITHFLTNNERQVTASFEGAPVGVEPFTVTTRTDRTYGDISLGIDILKRQGSTMRLDYTGQFSRNSSAHAISAKFSLPF
jgi:outer membrane autotransporter protein